MAKAKLVTRTATSSTVTDTNLNKGSALTHAEMDSNLINLRDASFGIRDDSSTVLQVTKDKTIHIAGGNNCTSALSGDTITINATGDVTGSSTTTFTNKTFDADGTGNSLTNIEVANLKSGVLDTDLSSVAGTDTTLASAKAIKAYVDANAGGGSGDITSVVAGTGLTGGATSGDATLNVIGGTGITANANDIAIDATVATLAGSQTFTNKTIDANGTGNNISNIDIGNMTAAVIVLESEGIGSNDNDTTIPTSAAVKAYADSVGGGGGVSLSGSTNNTIATVTGSNALAGEANLTFDGSTLAVTGAATVSTTLGVTGASNLDGVTITDNTISTNASNADLIFGTNGTGRFGMSVDGSDFWSNPLYETYFGTTDNVKTMGISRQETVDANAAARNYMIGVAQNTTLSGSSSSNSNFRPRTLNMANSVDMAGFSYTKSGDSRGPKAGQMVTNVVNSGSSASTLQAAQGGRNYVASYDETGSQTFSQSDLTVSRAIACSGEFELYTQGGSANFTFTNAFNFMTSAYVDARHTITNLYGYYVAEPVDSSGTITNNYAFYDGTSDATSLIGGVTLQNGDVTTGAISLVDNKIKANRSNDSICIQGNGTGQVLLAANGGDYTNVSTNGRYDNANILLFQDLDHTLGTASSDRAYKNVIAQDIKLTASQNSSDSDQRWRNQALLNLELNGSSSTATSGQYRSRGPVAFEAYSYITNNSSTNATLGQASGGNYGVSVYPGSSGDLTITNLTGMGTYFELNPDAGDLTITDCVGYESIGIDYYQSSSTTAITDFYHFRAGAHSFDGQSNKVTNDYAFFTESATALSQFGAVRLLNQGSDPGNVADTSHIYAKDESSSSEVFVRDEAGNVTKISPHNKAGEWEYYSVNKNTGKKVRVNMEKMIRKLEEFTGETFMESE